MRELDVAKVDGPMVRVPNNPARVAPKDDLFRRLLQILNPGRGRLILVRSGDTTASAAVIAELLNRRGGDGRVVLHPADEPPTPYRASLSRAGSWRVLRANDVPGSIEQTARSLRASETMVVAETRDVLLRALWLPPSVLEGYAQLPEGSDGVLVVDDWHLIVQEYLGGTPLGDLWATDARDLDPILVEMFRALSEVHFVIVTSKSSPALEAAADAIVDVGPRSDRGARFEVRLVRDSIEVPPGQAYVLQLRRDGSLAAG